jgi:thiol:disulfide interchange protein DsbD
MATFEGRAIAYVPVTVPADAPLGEATSTFKLTYQTCDDKTCLPPTVEEERSLTVRIVETPAAPPDLSGDLAGFPMDMYASLRPAAASVPAGRPQLPPLGRPALPQFGDSRDQVVTSVKAASAEAARGGALPVAVIFDINRRWHIWPQQGGAPTVETVFPTAIFTGVSVETSDAAALVPHAPFTQWPEPHKASVAGMGELETFEGRAIAYLPVTIPADAPLGDATLTFELAFQTCDDTQCLAPAIETKTLTVRIVDAATGAGSQSGPLTGDFEHFDPDVFQRIAAGSVPPATGGGIAPPADGGGATTPPAVMRPRFFGWTLPALNGPLGMILLALFSIIGGFILNLTPCVLPVIPIKIMTISKHAETPGRNLVLGLWMAAGVVAFWAGIGLPVAFVAGFTDPSRIFGIWWITLGIGLIIGLMGLGIMGLFMIQLPQSVYAINPKADTPFGSFMFGVMTAVLGLPCFGFIAGALLAGATALPALMVIVIFTSIGIGMAVPYLALAAWPSLVDRIPRTGPASELVKQVMGLLLLAAAAYFIGSGLIALIADRPYLARQLHWWTVALFAVISGLWLIVRTFQISPRAGARIAFTVIGFVIGAAAIWFAGNSTAKARTIWLDHQASAQSADGYLAGTWNTYTPAAFERARADGHIVVLDFTAEWCINCKFLKATVLNRDPVRSELAKSDVVSFTVDLTSFKDPGWDFLRSLGYTGIPLLVIYGPNGTDDTAWKSNAYTPQQVLEGLDDARR